MWGVAYVKYTPYLYSIIKTDRKMKATEEQIEKARAAAEKAKVPFEVALKMIVKQDEKRGWQPMSAKSIAKAESRDKVASGKIKVTFDLGEKMRENARKNLPSSMR